MTMIHTAEAPFVDPPRLVAPLHLRWEAAEESYVLLHPNGPIRLNASAGAILARCDGTLPERTIVAQLEEQFDARDIADEVHGFLLTAHEEGWIV
ncbi:pyrroloquinoline quinone biosynthesis peptide chaperone PqqD [Derxia lacustris]|uniref:pyrroloquinoline quinone biosynthesis peptide chaperone PqqD n=1 Tax=Derxia lacustris TaxID=764842 RepID=UPI001F1E94F0|nr:pyrroloquinoline quinone biosynthesis peptide chaperone PqqD [Derxia lacustris]